MNKMIRKFTINSLFILMAIIIGIIIFEIILRIAGISYPVFDTYDEFRGIALKPHKEGWYSTEGNAYLRVNSLGYRDKEHSIEKPSNSFRIAVLGDSFTEARQVALEDTFTSYLERSLGSCSALKGKNVENLNFGIAGFGTTQQLLTLQKHVWEFDPDLVLLAVFTENDIIDNSKELVNRSPWHNKFRPFHLLEDGELVLDNSFRNFSGKFIKQYIMYTAIHHSRLLEILNQARKVWKNRETQQQKNTNLSRSAGIDPILELYSPQESADWKNAWLITEKLFAIIQQEVKSKGAKFVLTTLSNPDQVHPDIAKRSDFKQGLEIKDVFYPERTIRSMGDKYDFPVITLSERLQQIAAEENLFLHGFDNTIMGEGHWNESGHKYAGQMIAEELCTIIEASQ